ncbi:MAG: hypothetical protein ACRDID_01300, partial [Ktedonobacterales bacterium]
AALARRPAGVAATAGRLLMRSTPDSFVPPQRRVRYLLRRAEAGAITRPPPLAFSEHSAKGDFPFNYAA